MTKNGDILHEYEPVEFEQLRATIAAKPKAKKRVEVRWVRHHRKLAVGLIIAMFILAPVAAQAVLSFVFPPVPAVGIIENCGQLVASKTTVNLGSSGFVLFTCASYAPAFKALGGTKITGNGTLEAPYTALYAYPSGQESNILTTCTDTPAALSLNQTLIFGYTGEWSFCANYTNAQQTGLPGMTWGMIW